MIALEYDMVLHNQSLLASRIMKKIHFFSFVLKIPFLSIILSIRHKSKKINEGLAESLISARGLHASLILLNSIGKENFNKLNPALLLDHTKEVIKNYSELSVQIAKIYTDSNESAHFYKFTNSTNIINETLKCYYDIQRLLKKASLQPSQETSQFALDSVAHSAKTFQKVVYGN